MLSIAADLSSHHVQSRLAKRPCSGGLDGFWWLRTLPAAGAGQPPSRSSLKHPACGSAVESLPQAGPVSPAPRRPPISTTNLPRGPGLFAAGRLNGEPFVTNVRRFAEAHRAPSASLLSA